MPSADIDAVLVGIRIASYGHAMDLSVQCPACSTDDEISVDLRIINDRLKIGDYNHSLTIGDLEFWFQPINYKSVNENSQMQLEQQQAMRVMESDVDDKVKAEQLNRSMMLITETTTKTIAQSIAVIKTPQAMVQETEYIIDFLKNCDSKIFNQLRDHVIKIKQQSDIQPLALTCKHCNHAYTQPFTLDLSSFFDNAS
jgi:hypothetical protein